MDYKSFCNISNTHEYVSSQYGLQYIPECSPKAINSGTDPEINHRGGWLRFEVGSFIEHYHLTGVSLACIVCEAHSPYKTCSCWASGGWPQEDFENLLFSN